MEFSRLRRRNRIQPTRGTPSPNPTQTATHQPPVSIDAQSVAGGDPDPSPLALSAKSQWPNRFLRTLLPSTHRAAAGECLVDAPPEWGPEPTFWTESPFPTTQDKSELQDWLNGRGLGGRPANTTSLNSGDDTRKRRRQGILPASFSSPDAPSQPVSHLDENKLFACPFYKLDPEIYRDCRRFGISRVKDVKLHLQRKHSSAGSCGQSCEPTGAHRHLPGNQAPGHEQCEGQDCAVSSSISQRQWERLGQKYQSRRKPVDEQWKDIWRILFPWREPPQSVYLESDTKEMLPRLREFWSRRRQDITNKTIQQSGPLYGRDCATDVFDHVIELFLSEFEAESKGTPSGVFDSSDVPQDLPYTDATCEDDDSVASTSANPYLSPEGGDFSLSFKHILGHDVKPTSSWPTQFSTPHDQTLSTCPSTDSLPGGFGELILGSENEGVWIDSCGVISDPVYYSVDVSGDSMVVDLDLCPEIIPGHVHRCGCFEWRDQ